MLKKDGLYFAYLRKSREDKEAEEHGQGETLAKHEHILDDLAVRYEIFISKKYKEVVSGETIASRPQMLRLLDDTETLHPDGILVVEVERLARGDTRDQGLILETFKCCNTKIVTPMKIYDPNNEFDEEYFEFGLFMSRREYKTIKRRLMSGTQSAVKEGKWPYGKAPYGYETCKLKGEKGYSLKVIPHEADAVRLIFAMYTYGTPETGHKPVSTTTIGKVLDSLNIQPRQAAHWVPGVIRDILTNCVYAGMVRYGHRSAVRVVKSGVSKKTYPVSSTFQIHKGIHDAIISEEIFNEAQKIFASRSRRPAFLDTGLKNSLAGILLCGNCHHSLIRRPGQSKEQHDWYICKHCSMPGAAVDIIEEKVIEALISWLENYTISIKSQSESVVNTEILQGFIDTELITQAELRKQLTKIYEFLEKEIYDIDTFKTRSTELKDKIGFSEKKVLSLQERIKKQADQNMTKEKLVPKTEHLLEQYHILSPAEKNSLLKEIVEKIEYIKETKGTRTAAGDFTLKIYPKL